MTQLRTVTCHMGSHSVTCYATQVNTPRLNPSYVGMAQVEKMTLLNVTWQLWTAKTGHCSLWYDKLYQREACIYTQQNL